VTLEVRRGEFKILGATSPVVMTSRADIAEGKVNAIAMAYLIGFQI